jgi:hypothetical protein
LPVKIDLPGYQLTYVARAAALGQLGECERAKDQLSQLIALRQDPAESVRREVGKWYQLDLVEHWIEGLRKTDWRFRQLRKKFRSKVPAALSPSPSPCGVIGIEPETPLYFPCSCAVQF